LIPTRVTEALGIAFPVFQGGMAWAGDYRLAAAVSEAGGLGIIGSGTMPPEELRRQIESLRKITDNPFGVNLLLYRSDVGRMVELVRSEEVPVVTTGAGSPGKHMEALMKGGARVFPVVASVDLAKRVERYGAAGVVCEGHEAAGHIGDITTMSLVPQVADAVKIPVVAAGGIADGRGMAAAFMLGAEAVQMGTRFTCAAEAPVHDNWKRAVMKARDRATVISGRTAGHPVRSLRNRLTRRFEKMEKDGAAPEELVKLGEGALQRAVVEGDTEEGSVMIGQIAGLVREIKPAREIIEEIVAEAEEIVARVAAVFGAEKERK